MTWVEPEMWYRNLPTIYAAAGALITDPRDRILLVKANYREHWTFPGGVMDLGEKPHETAARELAEETGIRAEIGDLLVVDWTPPMGKRPSPMVFFLFDGGSIHDTAAFDPDTEEIEDVRFFGVAECPSMMPSHLADRAPAALAARRERRTRYLPG